MEGVSTSVLILWCQLTSFNAGMCHHYMCTYGTSTQDSMMRCAIIIYVYIWYQDTRFNDGMCYHYICVHMVQAHQFRAAVCHRYYTSLVNKKNFRQSPGPLTTRRDVRFQCNFITIKQIEEIHNCLG